MARVAAELAFRPAGGGTVVNVTLSPHHGLAGMTHSSAARAAVEGLTRALAREWRDDGIAVLALAAGHFDTESLRKYPKPVWKAAARTVPLQRLGREEEHAWLVALACSPLGRALSGSVITLDGARDNWFGPWPPNRLPPTPARCRRRRDGRVERRRARLGLRHPLRELLAELLPAEVTRDPLDLLRRLPGPVDLHHVPAALERTVRASQRECSAARLRCRTRYAMLSAIQTTAKTISRSRSANYFLLLLSAIDPPPPREIAVTFAGIDFSASMSAQAGQFSYERPSVSLTCCGCARAGGRRASC